MFKDGGSSQTVVWKAASYPVPGPLSEHVVVNETVLFSIPIVFGTSFELVVLGQSIAATRSQTGGGHSASDFMQTLWWDGVQGVKVGGQAVQGYTLTSGSGIDWTQAAVVPEPSAWLLMAAGLGLLAVRRRAARPQAAG
ncbi:MAG: hypothetical protein CFE45_43160 [Burkholderiales bacterium PBB5]|nr:MAG: hypothetical protein CFE45_43160 [Burkholderiales bacterium PBB5]